MGMKLKNHDKFKYDNQPHIKPHLDFLEKIFNDKGDDKIISELNFEVSNFSTVSESGSESDKILDLNFKGTNITPDSKVSNFSTVSESDLYDNYTDNDFSGITDDATPLYSKIIQVTNINPVSKSVSHDYEYDKIISELNFEVTNINPDSKNVSDSDNIENIVINNKVDKVKTIYYEDDGKIKKKEIKYGKT